MTNTLLEYAAYSTANREAGCVNNEDAVLVDSRVHQGEINVIGEVNTTPRALFAISDGIHVSPRAALASKSLLKVFARVFNSTTNVPAGRRITQIHQEFSEMAASDPSVFAMSATLVAAEITGTRAEILHVGDSRAWLVDHKEARLLTRDHTTGERLSEEGEAGSNEADLASFYEGLDSYFCADSAHPRPRSDVTAVDLTPTQTLLLCSDGLHPVPGRELLRPADEPLSVYVERLARLATMHGSDDNISVLAARHRAMPNNPIHHGD